MNYNEINTRYSDLAESACCLSCGGAVIHSAPAPGEICVDLGSGRGTDAMRLAEAVGGGGYVYGIDISDGMIKKSRESAGRLGITNVEFVKSALEDINLESSIADLVVSNCTINHASDKQLVWNEIFRILKSGGRFVVSDIYAISPIPDEYRNDPVAVSECWAGSVTRDEYLQQLNIAGFTSLRVIEESEPYLKGKVSVASWTIFGEKR
jgi:ubiquinone/menaquinone biosynthesis C-methylase UbiE